MAIAMIFENPQGSQELYEEFSLKMFGGKVTPDNPIEGLIVHTAGPAKGGWRIFDVWESKEDYDRFMKDYVEPAMAGMGDMGDMSQMPEPELYELANIVVSGVGATA